jgi:uroporphyrinogen-III decarboxylase
VSRFCVASGCEVPPALSTNLDNIKIMCDTVRELGPKYQAQLN